MKGNTAQLKSSVLPPAGEKGYCFTFWYHMFGSTVGSLKMILKTPDTQEQTLVTHVLTFNNVKVDVSTCVVQRASIES